MSQPVLVIHGAGEPRRRGGRIYWEPLLGDALGAGYEVRAPRMPAPENPHHAAWADRIAQLTSEVAAPVLVGHSFGASTLLKFLSQASPRPALRGLFLVATPFWSPDFPEYALTPEQVDWLRSVAPVTFYHGRDDEDVEFSHFQRFQQALPHATFRALDGRGHEFDQASFPELVADIRGLAASPSGAEARRPAPLTFDDVRALGRALPGVEEGTSYGTPALKVRGKLMARLWEDGTTLVLKVPFAVRDHLLASAPETFFVTEHYRGYPAVLARLAAADRTQLGLLLEEAWRQVAPKRAVAAYDARRPGSR